MPRKSEVGHARLEPQRCDTRGPIPRPQLEFLLRHPDGSSGFCSVQRRGNLLSLNETHAVFLSFSSRLRIPPQSKERCLLVASGFCGALSKSEQISAFAGNWSRALSAIVASSLPLLSIFLVQL